LDLSKFEKLTLPWVACDDDVIRIVFSNEKKQDFLDIGSIDKNAFVELSNSAYLRLNIQLKLQPQTYDKLDFKNLIHLKELWLEKTKLDREFDFPHPQKLFGLESATQSRKVDHRLFCFQIEHVDSFEKLEFSSSRQSTSSLQILNI
jgi:hypothetical protein